MLANSVINSFLAGEVSERLHGRTDLDLYGKGCKELTNMCVRPQGGADRRPGSVFSAPAIDQASKSRLMTYDQSDEASFILEFSNSALCFFKGTDHVREANQTITAITQANPGVVTITGHPFNNGDRVYLDSIVGMTELNGRVATVANKTANTFELSGIDTTGFTAYSSAGTAARIYKITSPYATADLFDLQAAQDDDEMFISHGSYPTKKLVRTADTSWAISSVDFQDGPYLPENTTSTTVTPSGTSGTITLTASTAIFAATDTSGTGGTGQYDRLFRFKDAGGTWHWMKITAYTSTTVVTAAIQDGTTLSAATAVTTWRLGSFSDTTGYPKSVFIAEQRLVLASTDSQRQTYFYSKAGFYETMTPGTNDDDATSYDFAGRRVNPVYWISALDTEVLSGTRFTELRRSGAVTPGDSTLRPASYEGSAYVQPIEVPEAVVFVHRTKARIMAVSVNRLNQQVPVYETQDLTWAADHISGGGFVQLAYSHHPCRSILAVCNDGTMAVGSYEKKAGAMAWSPWETDGLFESVAVIPAAADGIEQTDRIWAVVKRTIDGNTVRYVEYFDPEIMTDCSKTYSGSETTTPGGLSHLEGESVVVKVDGAVVANETVTDGDFTLDAAGAEIIAGLEYTHTITPLPPELNSGRGTNMGSKRRTHQVMLQVKDSLGGKVNDDFLYYRDSSELMDSAPSPFTGIIQIPVNTAFSRDGTFTITGSQPYKFTLNAIISVGNYAQA